MSEFWYSDLKSNGGLAGDRTPVLTKIHPDFYILILFSLVRTLIRNKQDTNA